jgi:hypothetical protein
MNDKDEKEIQPLLVTRADAAAMCSVSLDTFDRHVAMQLPRMMVGRRIQFLRAGVEEWIRRECGRIVPPPVVEPPSVAQPLSEWRPTLDRRRKSRNAPGVDYNAQTKTKRPNGKVD